MTQFTGFAAAPVVAHGMRKVAARSIPALHAAPVAAHCWVIEEEALFLDVEGVGTYTLMWSRTDAPAAAGFLPGDGLLADGGQSDALALAAGFLLTEGLIERLADVAQIAACPDTPSVVRIRLVDPSRVRTHRRGGLIASACGLCGGVDGVTALGAGIAPVADRLRIAPPGVQQLMALMERRQVVFSATGGAHAAALFDAEGRVLATAEDLGRHNALDKVIGRRLLSGLPTAGCGAVLSGRVSLEMIAKSARAGIELVAAVSAPSSLAIDAAERFGITLCGFVRNGRLTAFSHPHRLD